MNRFLDFKATFVIACVALASSASTVFGQANVAWTGSGDGSTFSDDNNWFATESMGSGIGGPEFSYVNDSLKFSTAGATINNDLDPASNGGTALQLGLGFGGTEANSAAFHFLSGSGDFTFNGFGVTAGQVDPATLAGEQGGVIRADAGAGMLQTFNIPMTLPGGQKRRKVVMGNSIFGDPETPTVPTQYGTAVFNGDINFINSIMFIDEVAGRVELNGNNTGDGPNQIGPNTASGSNSSRATVRNNVANTVLHLGSDTALGNPTAGFWEGEDDGMGGRNNYLALRGLTAQGILNIEATAARDLSDYFFNIANASGGGGIKIDNASDTSIGYLMRTGNGTRTFSSTNNGKLSIEHGLFVSHNDQGRDIGLFAGGTSGNVFGGSGHIEINGRLHTSLIDPATATTNGTAATGGIAVANQFLAADTTTLINGSVNIRFGTMSLNGDSGTTWIGSQVVASHGSTVLVGHDNAFGDSNSLVSVNANAGVKSIVDIGSHTIGQRFVNTAGTIRGTGSLTHEADWSITGTVQPGGETPTVSDTLTFNFSDASVGNVLQFGATSTLDFVLNAGTTSSTINVLGPTLGGTTTIDFVDNSTINLTDLSGGNLVLGDYTLIDGDANTSFTLGSVDVAAPSGLSGSLSVSGDDLILSLAVASDDDADFNSMNGVDGADFLTWQRNIGFTFPGDLQPFGDANGDDAIDGDDLAVWQDQYGTNPASAPSASAVPEPTTLALLLVGLTACAAKRRVRA